MQQSKIFYPQHESYAPPSVDRPDAQPSQPFPAVVLSENLASVGFHMAPCGCFFDPRIYRIEWATANFLQPSVYKLSGGPVPPNTYLLDSPKYAPYHPAYQPMAASNSPYVLPFFKPEGSPATTAPNLTDPVGGLLGAPPHLPTFVDSPPLPQAEGLGPSERPKLPGPNPIQATGAYEPLGPCQDLAFQVFQGFLAEEEEEEKENRELKDNPAAPDFAERSPPIPSAHPEERSVFGPSGDEATREAKIGPDLGRTVTEDNALLEELDEPSDLPDKVLLEVAMKLFDCSPVNSDAELSLDGFGNGGRGWVLGDSCPSGGDSASDIRSLNLPDELLSFDYSVPEILGALTSLDYLYNVNAFGEESPWDSRPSSAQPLLKHPEPQLEPEGKANSKAKEALVQSGDGECPEPELATLAV